MGWWSLLLIGGLAVYGMDCFYYNSNLLLAERYCDERTPALFVGAMLLAGLPLWLLKKSGNKKRNGANKP